MVKDPGSQGITQIWQCENPECNFRFPTLLHVRTSTSPEAIHQCPKCGAQISQILPLKQANQNQPVLSPSPTAIRSIHPVEVLLDNLRSTFNVGAIFRSSDGAGVKHIHLCGTTPTPDHPKISKTALGAENTISWTYHPNAVMAASEFRKKSSPYQLWALEGGRFSEDLFEVVSHPLPPEPILLIVGNEVSGVDPELLEMCDKIVEIPMLGFKRSLNVAIASGIAIYSICVSASYFSSRRFNHSNA